MQIYAQVDKKTKSSKAESQIVACVEESTFHTCLVKQTWREPAEDQAELGYALQFEADTAL